MKYFILLFSSIREDPEYKYLYDDDVAFFRDEKVYIDSRYPRENAYKRELNPEYKSVHKRAFTNYLFITIVKH